MILRLLPLVISLAVALSSCAQFALNSAKRDKDFGPTATLLERVGKKCDQFMKQKNELLAQKECFPLLKDKKLLIQLKRISVNYSISLEGNASAKQLEVNCSASDALKEKLQSNPNLVEIGKRYWVSGHFKRFTKAYPSGWYTFYLDNCELTAYQPETSTDKKATPSR